jgi:GDP-mannose 6-dehydrogenase
MKISVFGLGYVGCVSLGCLGQNGHNVIGVDIVDAKIDLVNSGKPTIIEKDIDHIIYEQWKLGHVSATKDYIKAVNNSDVSIICVGTPATDKGHLNLDYIYNTARQIGEGLKNKNNFHVIVIRSTVMPGTNMKVGCIIEEISAGKRDKDFAVVSNPEFMREGSSVQDYYNPPFTVIGSENERAVNVMKEIYKDINAPIEIIPIEAAEIIKFINNSFHALKITFANEIGNICKKLGIDSHIVMDLFCKDTHLNLSPYYLKPGFAYGGSCLPKDLKGLKTMAHDFYLNSPVLESIELSNENQKRIAFDMIVNKGKKRIGILGLSFKKGTDDLRNSPFVELTEKLLGQGYGILIYDENLIFSEIVGTNKEYIDKHIPHLTKLMSDDLNYVIDNSEVLVISQNEVKFKEFEKTYKDKIIIDLVRTTNRTSAENYEGICW